jgi:glycosyltransferase involved in cell wall biosynthesis
MRIFNIMMSRGLGGIEQSFLDYGKAMLSENNQVFNVTSVGAKINSYIKNNHNLPNLFPWCIFSKIYLRILIFLYKPDIIIAHGGRAIQFTKALKPRQVPLIGVAHNYSYKYFKFCDYMIVITDHLRKYMKSNGYDDSKIVKIPNMIEIKNQYIPRKFKDPIVIGTLGRFVKKKGFEDYIKSIAILTARGMQIKAVIGGDGPEAKALKNLIREYDLEKIISFVGWVKDKERFFKEIDIFCLPSLEEPFGIVLLEAMEHSLPIVSTSSSGPSEILRNNQDGLLSPIGMPENMADNLNQLINNHQKSINLSSSAYLRLTKNYDIRSVSKKLSKFLNQIVDTHEF